MTKGRLAILVLIVAAIAACAHKAKSHRESEWRGLTESEARSKLDTKLPDKIPAEKRSQISDKVVAKMREHGVISDDALDPDDPDTVGVSDEEAHLAHN